jgi:hypothetical protein
MKRAKLLFDVVEYILFRVFLLVMLLIGILAIIGQNWSWHR